MADVGGLALANATVVIWNGAGSKLQTMTDGGGRFSFGGLEAGNTK